VLAIPALLAELTPALIRETLECVRTADVERWVKAHLGDSMLARRRRALTPLTADTKTA
jgi:hypothetical protein